MKRIKKIAFFKEDLTSLDLDYEVGKPQEKIFEIDFNDIEHLRKAMKKLGEFKGWETSIEDSRKIVKRFIELQEN
jgi:hypothetical protein